LHGLGEVDAYTATRRKLAELKAMKRTPEQEAVKVKNIERSIRKIEALDRKIKPLQEKTDAITQCSAPCQPPPCLGRTLDKIIALKERQAKIWNEELRSKVIGSKTLWQLALASRHAVVRFGEEHLLNFTGKDIRELTTCGGDHEEGNERCE